MVIAERVAQTAFIILTLTGVINKTGFLIGITAFTVLEAGALAFCGRQLLCCDKNGTAIKCALAFFICFSALPICRTAFGSMNYKVCAWAFTGWNVLFLSQYLISLGCKKRLEEEHGVRIPFC